MVNRNRTMKKRRNVRRTKKRGGSFEDNESVAEAVIKEVKDAIKPMDPVNYLNFHFSTFRTIPYLMITKYSNEDKYQFVIITDKNHGIMKQLTNKSESYAASEREKGITIKPLIESSTNEDKFISKIDLTSGEPYYTTDTSSYAFYKVSDSKELTALKDEYIRSKTAAAGGKRRKSKKTRKSKKSRKSKRTKRKTTKRRRR
jgi:hypothetical protein